MLSEIFLCSFKHSFLQTKNVAHGPRQPGNKKDIKTIPQKRTIENSSETKDVLVSLTLPFKINRFSLNAACKKNVGHGRNTVTG